ncbi:MAG: class I SAM-dependent methyltransferase [Chloroflexi bacterium]|nr:class I SAM-dependent methyltransferase [Chloroflexota bacterium]
MKRQAARFLTRLLMRLNNVCYRQISGLSIVAEGGTHPKHRLMDYHRFFVENIKPGDSVLDIGCGNGFLTYDIAAKAGTVTALDHSPASIAAARQDFRRENITYVLADAAAWQPAIKYDVVVLSNVLEHIVDRHDFLARLKGMAGRLLLRVPALDRDWLTYYKKELDIDYRLDRDHKIEYTMASLEAELAAAGMRIQSACTRFGEIWAVIALNDADATER